MLCKSRPSKGVWGKIFEGEKLAFGGGVSPPLYETLYTCMHVGIISLYMYINVQAVKLSPIPPSPPSHSTPGAGPEQGGPHRAGAGVLCQRCGAHEVLQSVWGGGCSRGNEHFEGVYMYMYVMHPFCPLAYYM